MFARLDKEMTADVLRQRINVSPATLRKFERGESEPQVAKLLEISDALEVGFLWLLFGDDIPEKIINELKDRENGN